jgi:hypothetical protein
MDDQNAMFLLRGLHAYVMDYPGAGLDHMTVADVAEDLAMSMDVTTHEADRMRREIASMLDLEGLTESDADSAA